MSAIDAMAQIARVARIWVTCYWIFIKDRLESPRDKLSDTRNRSIRAESC